jgi:hypothetical protein
MDKHRVEETSSTTVTIKYENDGRSTIEGSSIELELDSYGHIFHEDEAVASIDGQVGGTDSTLSIRVTAQAGNNDQVVIDLVSCSQAEPSSPSQANTGGVTWTPTSTGGQDITLTAPTISGYALEYSLRFVGQHEPPVKLPVTVRRT